MHADPPNPGATATLKRVRDTEVDLASRLAAIHAATESALTTLKNDAEKAVRSAAAEAERSREAAITAARHRLEADAAKIESDGRTEAQRIESAQEFDLARLRPPLLKAVLEGFAGDSEP
ncbi:MAG: hypothetical protein L3K17_00245 [Thermoplasmata archaeon]|nr:hypothetical protein [Thermoplasmata archaeon]